MKDHISNFKFHSDNLEGLASLLFDMPGLTFIKDTGTGQYLCCNQNYAEYVHKEKVEDVIGLTDFDLHGSDSAVAFLTHDRETLEMDAPNVFYEDIIDAHGRPRQVQTTKMKFVDSQGRLCIMGICIDVTDAMNRIRQSIQELPDYKRAHRDSITYSRIARALSANYAQLYYVNLETEQYIEYSSENGEEAIAFQRREDDFFNKSRARALEVIHSDDQALFIESFTKENILRTLDMQGTFTLTYRQIFDGIPNYMNMKVRRMSGDENHIIIGVNNVDAQLREQATLERIREEQITYSRISALMGGYLTVYTVDPETDHYTRYSATEEYEVLNLSEEGEDFFNRARRDSRRVISPRDLNRFATTFTKANVMEEISKEGSFSLRYRMRMKGGKDRWVNLRAALVEEKDGPQLIVGVEDVDAQVRREMDYERDISEANRKAIIDALTGVKNKFAYLEAQDEIDDSIAAGESVEFAIVICDVNLLKEVNDTQGHQAGDQLLKDACAIICNTFKRSPVYRVGGDEFAVISRDSDYHNMDDLIQTLMDINERNHESGGPIVACGMAKYQGDKKVEDVFHRADEEMYENKRLLKTKYGFPDR